MHRAEGPKRLWPVDWRYKIIAVVGSIYTYRCSTEYLPNFKSSSKLFFFFFDKKFRAEKRKKKKARKQPAWEGLYESTRARPVRMYASLLHMYA